MRSMAVQRNCCNDELARKLSLGTDLETPFRLLDLPPEIRCEIYIHFLISPLAIPHRTEEERVERNGRLSAQAHYSTERCTKFSGFAPQFSAVPLLLCNRQIYNEFTATISTFLNQNRLRYHLDCEINRERYLYPDWILLPVKASHIPCLYASFRFHGAAGSTTELDSITGLSHPTMVCSLLYILFRFLQRGPHLRSQVKDRNLTIGALVLDVLTPSLEPHQEFKPIGTVGEDRATSKGKVTIVHPETFVRLIRRYLESMLARRLDFSQVLTVLRSVGKIYLRHDGDQKAFWDLQAPTVRKSSESNSEDQ